MTDTFQVQGEFAPAESSMAVETLESAAIETGESTQSIQSAESVEAAVVAEDAAPALPNGFVRLGLAPELVQAVADLGYTQPTSVQERAIPLAMGSGDGSSQFIDLMVSSQTGSGKTAAFLLPVLHTLIRQQAEADAAARDEYDRAAAEAVARGEPAPKRKRKDPTNPRNFKAAAPGALILCPTRELAQQVAHDAIELVKHCRGLRVANVVGGIPYQLQIAKLQNANLVVATPGRLLDLQRSMQIKLDQVQFLVVDEADRMLDLGFSDDLAELNQLTAQRQQTMMFSATFAPRIQQLAMRVMHDNGSSVQKIQIDSPQEKHANIKQVLFWADNAQHKRKLLDHWLRDTTINQAIVFASTQVECDGLANDLQQEGFSAVALHGALSQGLRNRRLMALRSGQVQVLVATDVAARGIDVPTITHVFNYGLPMKAEDYTHRIGRTGRAGRDGLAVTFAEFRDRRKIFDIEGYSKQQFKSEVVPGLEPQQRAPQARPEFGGRGRQGGYENRDGFSRDRKPAGAGRGGFGGGFAGNDRSGFGGRGAPAPRAAGGGYQGAGGHAAPRDEQRGFGNGPRRDGDSYGRKPGFGESPRGNSFGGGRNEGGGAPRGDFSPRGDFAPRGEFAPRKPAFAKPGAGGGKPFVPHDARKRPARPAR
ncbi:Superfamily II DNA and RNA helicase [Paracidovorax valerianellae]|uniref:Superfamily II DNA and RNA helicase n=1 Tax=Paracidovorax valerianellae TaxID=187868 RepID=A0A1G6MJC3_9BURK|nr:DEAD/DEAH box helicase [Paracidovorax valerianellae]SDC55394.1 Superfamily II DNA and RNA helicase [Paracidovorax valerianellae]